jgi:ABC-type nitrate/sulfonate/bicarbonate transport system ATPase subunit
MPYALQVSNLSKTFFSGGSRLDVLSDVSIRVDCGEMAAVVGPSGSGKSTLLNIVAGLDDATSGTVALNGDAASARLGRVAYMPQKDLLLPWRTVLGNAVLGLEVQGVARAAARDRAASLLEVFGLRGFEHTHPHQLSGGMRQRVAFLRTILADKPVLLLDEPFGALDALTRAEMQSWLLGLWQGFGRAGVLVTHDVEEALLLSSRVYVLTSRPGRVRRVVEVPLPWPRARHMAASAEFSALKEELLELLWEKTAA